MWVTWVQRLEERESQILSRVKGQGRGSLRIVCSAVFFQHEVWVLHRLQKPTLEPHRKLTVFWLSLVTNCTWWLKYNIIIYNTPTCWHFPSWWRHQYWDSVCTLLAILWECSKFCIDCPNWASVLSWWRLNKLIEFSPKCSAGVLFHLCVRSVNATWM